MSNVYNLSSSREYNAISTETFNAMMSRNQDDAQKLLKVIDRSKAMQANLAYIPHGHFARITDEGQEKIVWVCELDMYLVDGVKKQCQFVERDTDPVVFRQLHILHYPEDLGECSDFLDIHETVFKAILQCPNAPKTPMQMVHAVEYLIVNKVSLAEFVVTDAIEDFWSTYQHDLTQENKDRISNNLSNE